MCTVCIHPHRIPIKRDLLACSSAAAVAACHRLPLGEDAEKHKARLQVRLEDASHGNNFNQCWFKVAIFPVFLPGPWF